MCGIAGCVGASRNRPDAVSSMLYALRRRGPDSFGTHEFENASLGHRRLAIFDLSPLGHQPMLSPDGSVGLVFNGAIYNFRPLRRELEEQGFSFISETDTEVLIHGYRAWGIQRLVEKIRGMFAFALWDDRAQRLYMVRDRLGVKPLVYARDDRSIAFASTPRALRAGGFASTVSADAVAEFLQFGFVTERRAIYEEVSKLPPASIAEWSRDAFRVWEYWTPPATEQSSKVSFEDAVEETERLLLRAVEMRLQADVPIAALLSGGVDSTLVCWAIAKLRGDITAFTVGTPGHPVDETSDAVATAKELGIPHEILTASDDDDADIDILAEAYPEPFAVGSAIGMLRLSRAIAATDTKVLLTGDGGDDVFLGYPRHEMLMRTQAVAGWLPPVVGPAWRAARRAIPQRGVLKRVTHLVDYATGGLPAFLAANPGYRDFKREGLLGDRLMSASPHLHSGGESVRAARTALADYLEYDRETQFVSEYLVKVDGSTMHYALEARSPFLDQELWSFASTLPFSLRLHDGTLKAILREIARRNVGPRVAQGKKRGFEIPIQSWMGGKWHAKVAERLENSLIVSDGWVQKNPLRQEIASAKATGRASRRLWYLWILEEWLRGERSRESDSSMSTSATAQSAAS